MARHKYRYGVDNTAIIIIVLIGVTSALQIGRVLVGLFGLIIFACAYTIYRYFKARELKAHELDLKYIDSLSGRGFEEYMAKIFRNMGYKVQVTQESQDYGADLVISNSNQRICVQAKRYNPAYKVGIKAVQEVVASLNYYHAFRGIVVTNTTFTKAAYNLANVSRVQLVDRSKLLEMMSKVKKPEKIINTPLLRKNRL